jgi:bacterioferritin-associated ferredoxin
MEISYPRGTDLQFEVESRGQEILRLSIVRCVVDLGALRALALIKAALPATPRQLAERWLKVRAVQPGHTIGLVDEFLLKLADRWAPPIESLQPGATDELELCRCRAVPLSRVMEAIALSAADSPLQVAQQTGAGTACGTCRSDSQSLINYRRRALLDWLESGP